MEASNKVIKLLEVSKRAGEASRESGDWDKGHWETKKNSRKTW